jgi:hypothetical protein
MKYRITAEVLRERSGLTRGLPIGRFLSVMEVAIKNMDSNKKKSEESRVSD